MSFMTFQFFFALAVFIFKVQSLLLGKSSKIFGASSQLCQSTGPILKFKLFNAANNQVEVVFMPSNKAITVDIGTPLKDVASAADVTINYKCQKGECGTCQVQVEGKWIKTCQTKVLTDMKVTVKPVKEKPAFFSPQSLFDGFTNNALGVAGFVLESSKVDDEFKQRMERERILAEKVEAAKKSKLGK